MAGETLSLEDDREDKREPRVAQLVVILECDRTAAGSSRHLLRDVREARIGRGDVRRAERDGRGLALAIPDARMSSPHARCVLRDGRWYIEDAGSKNGVFVDGERRETMALHDGAIVQLGHTILLYCEAPVLADEPLDRDGGDTFVASFARAVADLAAVMATPAAVLIQGETGTGKEVLARRAHGFAGRSGPLVAVNCGALPSTLVESELFGYRKGAFSGADQDRPGLVRAADGGTLFLDEIADLPLPAQAALLRVLQEREVVPVGGTQPVRVDVRVIAASHHDLGKRVAEQLFRRDLYSRLAAFTVAIPPLRERLVDFGLLLQPMLAARDDVKISCAAVRAMLEYEWPLNVRELESCVTVSAALARGGAIKLEHLPEAVRSGAPANVRVPLGPEEQAQHDRLIALLSEHGGNISAIARATGKARPQIHRWLRRFGIDPDAYR
jgi:hypothetical protein